MSIHPEVPRHAVAPSLRVPSFADITLLAAATSENPALSDLHTVIKLMANTGIRLREATRLTWADVNLEQSYAIVRDSMGNTTRFVHLGPKTSQSLSLRERNPGDTYLLGGASPYCVERIARKFHAVSKKVGLTATRLHDLRVFFFVRVGSIGVDAQTFAHVVGCEGWQLLPQNSSCEESVAHPFQFEEV